MFICLKKGETISSLLKQHSEASRCTYLYLFRAFQLSDRYSSMLFKKKNLLILRWDIVLCNRKEMSNVSLTDGH